MRTALRILPVPGYRTNSGTERFPTHSIVERNSAWTWPPQKRNTGTIGIVAKYTRHTPK